MSSWEMTGDEVPGCCVKSDWCPTDAGVGCPSLCFPAAWVPCPGPCIFVGGSWATWAQGRSSCAGLATSAKLHSTSLSQTQMVTHRATHRPEDELRHCPGRSVLTQTLLGTDTLLRSYPHS